jgi:hypothetical protein
MSTPAQFQPKSGDDTLKPYGEFYPIEGTRLFTMFILMPTFVHPAQYIEYPMPNCGAIYISADGDKNFVSKKIKSLLPRCGSIDFDIISEKKYMSPKWGMFFDCTQLILFSTTAGVNIEGIKFT